MKDSTKRGVMKRQYMKDINTRKEVMNGQESRHNIRQHEKRINERAIQTIHKGHQYEERRSERTIHE